MCLGIVRMNRPYDLDESRDDEHAKKKSRTDAYDPEGLVTTCLHFFHV